LPIFLPNCIAPESITAANFQVIASVCALASRSDLYLVMFPQGSFGCALRIKPDGDCRRAVVIKVLDITQHSYKWVMREIFFGYHLAKKSFRHPNIAQLLHHYVPTPHTTNRRLAAVFISFKTTAEKA
jgi:hypothetical protein